MSSVGLKIDGGWLTGVLRSMVLEKNWTGAMQIMAEGIENLTWDLAIGILRGTFRLVSDGSGGFSVERDEEGVEAVLEKNVVNGTYGNYFMVHRSYYEAYAIVTSYGDVDFCGPRGVVVDEDTRRARFYSDDPSNDHVVKTPDGSVLCRSVAPPPIWYGEFAFRTEEHVKSDLIRSRIEERGYLLGLVSEPVSRSKANIEEMEAAIDKFVKEQLGDIEFVTCDGEVMTATEAVNRSQAVVHDPSPSKDYAGHANGWLSPRGVFYPCLYFEHNAYAAALVPSRDNCAIEKDGWIKLSAGRWLDAGRATPEQKGVIVDWCLARAVSPAIFLND